MSIATPIPGDNFIAYYCKCGIIHHGYDFAIKAFCERCQRNYKFLKGTKKEVIEELERMSITQPAIGPETNANGAERPNLLSHNSTNLLKRGISSGSEPALTTTTTNRYTG